ncbi:MAG TPA: glycosyl transferase family 2 [Prolixibacteraceae bacterium]|jgi:glycosyltransferase involved in cell wall biosynthesis|nr:glycosyl transferase family 2 [Prolixibacteraceae bacterium]
MKISLIISTFNKPEYLFHCLKSITELKEFPDEVIIADDGSGEETTQLIEQFKAQFPVPFIHIRQEDEGFRLARNRNNGLLTSTGDYLIFIDDDLILHPLFIADHRHYAMQGCFYCGSRVRIGPKKTAVLMKNHRNRISFWESDIQSRLSALRIPFLHKIITGPGYTPNRLRGCHMAFWKSDLISINGFDERYTSWGGEDSDIAMRMMHSGVKRINLKWAAICYHLYHSIIPTTHKNSPLLLETIQNKTILAPIGIKQHR